MVKRACLLCSKYVEERLLRRTTPSSHHTIVLLSSLVLFNAVDLKEAKRCYDACVRIRQRLCDQHYIDAAKLIASEMACLGIRFTTYLDEPRGVVVSYTNEKDIPLHLIDSVQENAKKLNAQLVVTPRRVSEFLNYCLSRYQADAFRPTVSADPQQETASSLAETENSNNDTVDMDPVALLCGTSDTPEVIVVGRDHSAEDTPAVEFIAEELDETDPALLEKKFVVKGNRLLSLFRFCPRCGTEINKNRRSIMLTEWGSSPIVHYICCSCLGKQCWFGM
ncbi:hypothetical protein ANCCAN_17477 [Ancylostoma caninum]|uniref:Uncharacterized protein n=1 Tax=Ancylostoma caninum TaxID=29170 RepID=A0A368FWQ6_ANCCA|nr:hypothetical protein ANCCAN_17477 [Ancylostoma caninum]